MASTRRPVPRTQKRLPLSDTTRFFLTAILLIGLLCVANYVMSFCMQPYGSITEVTWWAYRHADPELDTVFVGNSRMDAAIDPTSFDEGLGSCSLSLATMFQPLDDSLVAAQTALDEHHVQRVILGVSFSTFTTERHVQSSATFTQAKALGGSPLEALQDYWHMLTTDNVFFVDKSITALTPWTYTHVPYNFGAIRKNIHNRLTYDNPLDAGQHYTPDFWRIDDKGDRYIERTTGFGSLGARKPDTRDEDHSFGEEQKERFIQFLDSCEQYDTKVYVVVSPQHFYELINYGNAYPKEIRWVRDEVEARGGTFVDLNLAHEDYYRPTDKEWADGDHLNIKGSRRYSTTLAHTIARIEAGEDVSGDFYAYDEWDEMMAAFDRIDLLGFKAWAQDGGLAASIWSFEGSEVEAEYEVAVLNKETNDYEVVSPYDTAKERWWPMEGKGTCTVRVTARHKGSSGAPERKCVLKNISYGIT